MDEEEGEERRVVSESWRLGFAKKKKVDGTRTGGEVEIEETQPAFSLPGRNREGWRGPGAKTLQAGNERSIAVETSHLPSFSPPGPVSQGWLVKSPFYVIGSHYHMPLCHLQSPLCAPK